MVVHAYNGCVWERVPESCDLGYTMSSCQIRGWGASWTTGFQELEKRMKGSKTHFIFPIEWRPQLDQCGKHSPVGAEAYRESCTPDQPGCWSRNRSRHPDWTAFPPGSCLQDFPAKNIHIKIQWTSTDNSMSSNISCYNLLFCTVPICLFFFFLSFHQILIRWAGRKLSLFDR